MPPSRKLLEHGMRHSLGGGGDDDSIVRRQLGPAVGAIADDQRAILIAQRFQRRGRAGREFRVAFDADDPAGQFTQHRPFDSRCRCRFPAPTCFAGEFQRFGHQGHDVRLADGLAAIDGQCPIGIGSVANFLRNEEIAADISIAASTRGSRMPRRTSWST